MCEPVQFRSKLYEMEMQQWKGHYKIKKASERPSSAADTIEECDRDMFPNIYVLLQIACTMLVNSCECERSASGLRQLNNFMKTLMGALLHIHYDYCIYFDKAVDSFAKLHLCRLELESIL